MRISAMAIAGLVAGCSVAPVATTVGQYELPPHRRVVASNWVDCQGGCAAQIRALAGGSRASMRIYMGGPSLLPINLFGTNCHVSDMAIVQNGDSRAVEIFGPIYETPIVISLSRSDMLSLASGATIQAIFEGCGGDVPETREIVFDQAEMEAILAAQVPPPARI